jgi:Ca-activated chloride channel family protein
MLHRWPNSLYQYRINRSYGLWLGFRCLPTLIVAVIVGLLLTISPAHSSSLQHSEKREESAELSPNAVRGGEMLLRLASTGAYTPALIQTGKVHFDIRGMVATITLEQSFRNDTDDWVEGVYAFPLPDKAAVRHMEMRIGERLIVGKIKEKSVAKKIYNNAVRMGKKASLVEQRRPNLFTNRVANIGPDEEITVRLEYVQPLEYQHGEFFLRFPMTITPRYFPAQASDSLADGESSSNLNINEGMGWALPTQNNANGTPINRMQITAHLDAGMPLAAVSSSYHEIVLSRSKGSYEIHLAEGSSAMDRDFVLHWKPVTGSQPAAAVFTQRVGDDTYGLLMLVPPELSGAAQERTLPREVIFVIDTSGSMGGVSIEQAKASLALALAQLGPRDSFNIIEFNSQMRRLFRTPVPASRHTTQRAAEFVRQLQAGGGTEMLPALQAALSGQNVVQAESTPYRVRQVVFITDGAIGNEEQLFEEIISTVGDRRLFTVGIGAAPNSWFMRKAAQFGRGTHTHIGDISEVTQKMQILFDQISTPLATKLQVSWPTEVEAYPQRIPDLYQGLPLLVAFKLGSDKSVGEITVSGNVGSKQWSRRVQLHETGTADESETSAYASGVASIWARRKIDSLLDQKLMGVDEVVVKANVLGVALAHSLMCPYTSFVAVEERVSRPEGAALRSEALPNTQPKGQSMQQVTYPKTATTAPANLFLGGFFLFLMLITHALRQPEVDQDADEEA